MNESESDGFFSGHQWPQYHVDQQQNSDRGSIQDLRSNQASFDLLVRPQDNSPQSLPVNNANQVNYGVQIFEQHSSSVNCCDLAERAEESLSLDSRHRAELKVQDSLSQKFISQQSNYYSKSPDQKDKKQPIVFQDLAEQMRAKSYQKLLFEQKKPVALSSRADRHVQNSLNGPKSHLNKTPSQKSNWRNESQASCDLQASVQFPIQQPKFVINRSSNNPNRLPNSANINFMEQEDEDDNSVSEYGRQPVDHPPQQQLQSFQQLNQNRVPVNQMSNQQMMKEILFLRNQLQQRDTLIDRLKTDNNMLEHKIIAESKSASFYRRQVEHLKHFQPQNLVLNQRNNQGNFEGVILVNQNQVSDLSNNHQNEHPQQIEKPKNQVSQLSLASQSSSNSSCNSSYLKEAKNNYLISEVSAQVDSEDNEQKAQKDIQHKLKQESFKMQPQAAVGVISQLQKSLKESSKKNKKQIREEVQMMEAGKGSRKERCNFNQDEELPGANQIDQVQINQQDVHGRHLTSVVGSNEAISANLSDCGESSPRLKINVAKQSLNKMEERPKLISLSAVNPSQSSLLNPMISNLQSSGLTLLNNDSIVQPRHSSGQIQQNLSSEMDDAPEMSHPEEEEKVNLKQQYYYSSKQIRQKAISQDSPDQSPLPSQKNINQNKNQGDRIEQEESKEYIGQSHPNQAQMPFNMLIKEQQIPHRSNPAVKHNMPALNMEPLQNIEPLLCDQNGVSSIYHNTIQNISVHDEDLLEINKNKMDLGHQHCHSARNLQELASSSGGNLGQSQHLEQRSHQHPNQTVNQSRNNSHVIDRHNSGDQIYPSSTIMQQSRNQMRARPQSARNYLDQMHRFDSHQISPQTSQIEININHNQHGTTVLLQHNPNNANNMIERDINQSQLSQRYNRSQALANQIVYRISQQDALSVDNLNLNNNQDQASQSNRNAGSIASLNLSQSQIHPYHNNAVVSTNQNRQANNLLIHLNDSVPSDSQNVRSEDMYFDQFYQEENLLANQFDEEHIPQQNEQLMIQNPYQNQQQLIAGQIRPASQGSLGSQLINTQIQNYQNNQPLRPPSQRFLNSNHNLQEPVASLAQQMNPRQQSSGFNPMDNNNGQIQRVVQQQPRRSQVILPSNAPLVNRNLLASQQQNMRVFHSNPNNNNNSNLENNTIRNRPVQQFSSQPVQNQRREGFLGYNVGVQAQPLMQLDMHNASDDEEVLDPSFEYIMPRLPVQRQMRLVEPSGGDVDLELQNPALLQYQDAQSNLLGYNNMGQGMGGGSVNNDDLGIDEFEVAEERAHLFGDQPNPDIMTYEELLALQERIGFVSKGMTVKEMDRYPQMLRSELRKYMKINGITKVRDKNKKKVAKYNKHSEERKQEEDLPGVPSNLSLNSELVQDNQNEQELEQICMLQPVISHSVQLMRSQQPEELNNHCQQQDELLPGEERKVPPPQVNKIVRNNNSSSCQILSNSSQSPRSLSNLAQPNLNNVQNQSSHQSADFFPPISAEENFNDSDLGAQEFLIDSSRQQQVNINNAHSSNMIQPFNSQIEEEVKSANHSQQQQLVLLSSLQNQFPLHHQNQQSQQNQAQIQQLGAVEDAIFDEGEDVVRRQLPVLNNIQGSIPQQTPFNNIGFTVDMEERKSVTFVRSIMGAQRLRQLNQMPQVVPEISEDLEEDEQDELDAEDLDEAGYSANLHEEHLQESRGIQAPKYNQTKHNKINRPRHHNFVAEHHHHHLHHRQNSSQSQQNVAVRCSHQGHLLNNGSSAMAANSQHQSQQVQGNLSDREGMQGNSSVLDSSVMSMSSQQSRELCIICYDNIHMTDMIKVLQPCNHYFHRDCINQWLLVEKKCPMCMAVLT